MPEVFLFRHRVRADEIDMLGHANNVVYVQWLQDAAVAHSEAQGWPGRRHLAVGSGWVVRSHYIEYLEPARAGDEIVVQTWVASFKKVTSVRRYRIYRAPDGLLLARAETHWAYVAYATGKPCRIPQEVIDAFVAAGEDVPPYSPPSGRNRPNWAEDAGASATAVASAPDRSP
ncbi:MAG: acyl-CoA thioesterase [Thermogutta sp.]|nr:acyl-CoA thioesterase [Thermogutta sp.]